MLLWVSVVAGAREPTLPPPSRANVEMVDVGFGASPLSRLPVVIRGDLCGFERGWALGLTGSLGVGGVPGGVAFDALALDLWLSVDPDVRLRLGHRTAIVLPFVGYTETNEAFAGYTTLGPIAGAFVDLWHIERDGPMIHGTAVRLVPELKLLASPAPGRFAWGAVPSISLVYGALGGSVRAPVAID